MIYRFSTVSLLVAALLLSSCSNPRIHRLTDVKYEARKPADPVDLYDDKVERDYMPIAVIDSLRHRVEAGGPDEATREQMKEELRTVARLVGAEAVHNVRILPVQVEGYVEDESVPFEGAVRQGVVEYNFMRGEAIIFVDPADGPEQPVRPPREAQISD